MSTIKFDQLVALYRAINFKSDARQGTLTIANDEQRDFLVEILAKSDEYGLKVLQGDTDAFHAGQVVELEIADPRIALGIFATDLNDLLDAPKARIREPARYFVASEKFSKSDQNIPAAIVSYRSLIKLISLLKEAAAYLDEEAGELVFIHEGKFELSIQYFASDVLKTDSDSLSRLLESFEVDTHRDQKLAILAKSVQTLCKSAKPRERFGVLLEQFSDLLKSFSDGYRLFVADFSYDKIVNQLEVAKLEEIGKIHKTFSDIQNQILGIPVATIVVATQMKTASTIGYEFWINTAVLVGCWVFVILSAFVLRNQLHTLTAIGDEIARKKKQMMSDYKSIEDMITKSFPFLEARLEAQRLAFYAVGLILFVGFILAHVIYFWLTDPFREWMLSLFAG
ncbi:MAG: hypothetical protein PHY62_10985 [Gallionella sp.]|nr:hypothetical protein [Gallionella sp.]